jgi:cytochrome c
MRIRAIRFLTAAFTAVVLIGASQLTPDTSRGRELFERRCTGCHALDSMKAAPPLRAVFGRPAAGAARYPYSDALKQSRITWDEESLDKWLSDPERLIPGNDMSFRLDNATERADIIAYLKQLRTK